MLELFVEAGPQSGQRFALQSNTVLGRGQFADLVIADLAVSRRHAQIEPDGSAWLLRDLESAGLAASSWGEDSLGPQRRMYTITPQGESTLAEWVPALRQRRREIEALEAAYNAVKKNN